MNKFLIASIVSAAALLSACGESESAKPAGSATAASAASAASSAPAAPQVQAPKPPAPTGGGKSAPELSPEDIARIQEMLKKRAAEPAKAAAPAAAAAPAPATH